MRDYRLNLFNPSLNEDYYLDEGFFSVRGADPNRRTIGGGYNNDAPRHMTPTSRSTMNNPPVQQQRPVNNNSSFTPSNNNYSSSRGNIAIRPTAFRTGKNANGQTIISPEMAARLAANARDPYHVKMIKNMSPIEQSELRGRLEKMQSNLAKRSLNASAMPYLFKSPYLFLEDEDDYYDYDDESSYFNEAITGRVSRGMGHFSINNNPNANSHFSKGHVLDYRNGGIHSKYGLEKIASMTDYQRNKLRNQISKVTDEMRQRAQQESVMPYIYRSPYLFLEDDNEEKELKDKREKLSTFEKYSPLRIIGKGLGAISRHFHKGYTQGYGGIHRGMYGADMGYNPIPSKGFKEGADCCYCDCDDDDRLSLFKGHFSSSSLFDNDIDGTWDNVEDDFGKNYSLFRSPGDEFDRNINDVAFRSARTSGGIPHPLSAFNGVNKIS